MRASIEMHCCSACPHLAGHPLAQHAESAAALEELRTLFGFLEAMGALGPIVFDLRWVCTWPPNASLPCRSLCHGLRSTSSVCSLLLECVACQLCLCGPARSLAYYRGIIVPHSCSVSGFCCW